MKKITKLDRLTMLHDTLLECCKESVKNAEEWNTYHDMLIKAKELMHQERKAQGWEGVYKIENGCSTDCLFEGTKNSCDVYVDILLKGHPEMKGNIIITPLY